MNIKPAARICGKIRLPGDKSISHRAVMLAAIASGESRIENFADSEDCSATIACMSQLGVDIERDGSSVRVKGVGRNGLMPAEAVLDCGNSGTTVRLLSGILSGQAFGSTLTGDASLKKRPMSRIIEPLSMMGAEIGSNDGLLPLRITGKRPLKPIKYELPVASAQLKTCILLAGLFADGRTTVIEPTPTRDHTERMLEMFGAAAEADSMNGRRAISVSGGAELRAANISVPSDISSAAFFIAAAAGLEGSDIVLENVGLNPSRTAAIDAMRGLGARIDVRPHAPAASEPVGDIFVKGGIDREFNAAGRLEGDVIPNLIDELPILAVLGTQLEGGLEARDASELRVKESDRIAAIVENLRRMGADVTEFPDGFRVGRSKLRGARVESFGDHRIAMAFAVAGLFAEGETEIDGADCTAVSFPGFFEVLDGVVSY